LVCFATSRVSPGKHARHQRRGGISVGLIYRLFRKQGGGHFGDGGSPQGRNRRHAGTRAPRRKTLLESLEILFTAHWLFDHSDIVDLSEASPSTVDADASAEIV